MKCNNKVVFFNTREIFIVKEMLMSLKLCGTNRAEPSTRLDPISVQHLNNRIYSKQAHSDIILKLRYFNSHSNFVYGHLETLKIEKPDFFLFFGASNSF